MLRNSSSNTKVIAVNGLLLQKQCSKKSVNSTAAWARPKKRNWHSLLKQMLQISRLQTTKSWKASKYFATLSSDYDNLLSWAFQWKWLWHWFGRNTEENYSQLTALSFVLCIYDRNLQSKSNVELLRSMFLLVTRLDSSIVTASNTDSSGGSSRIIWQIEQPSRCSQCSVGKHETRGESICWRGDLSFLPLWFLFVFAKLLGRPWLRPLLCHVAVKNKLPVWSMDLICRSDRRTCNPSRKKG